MAHRAVSISHYEVIDGRALSIDNRGTMDTAYGDLHKHDASGHKKKEVIETEEKMLLHQGDGLVREEYKYMNHVILAVYCILFLLGIGTGYILARPSDQKGMTNQSQGMVQTKNVVGSTDTQTFKDSAEGVIEKGGTDGEGTHKLIREGGPSQTAFLISSIIDLESFVGKKVRVWGQTMAAKKAQWLMDVGKIELLE